MIGETIGSVIFTSSSSSSYLISSTNVTTGVIWTPQTRIFHIHLISGSSISNITITNGNGGTTEINITGVANKGKDFDFGWWGIVFPAGAYIVLDGNQAEVVFTCKGEDNYIMQGVVSGGGGSGGILDDSGNQILDDSGNVIVDDSGN